MWLMKLEAIVSNSRGSVKKCCRKIARKDVGLDFPIMELGFKLGLKVD